MVIVMMRMKLAVLRGSLSGPGLVRLGWGALFGLTGVILTFALGLADQVSPRLASDRLMIIFGIWTLGWALGPMLFSGEDKTLIPENFRFLPVTPNQLATGLLGASFIGVPAVISLLAFIPLVIYAAGLGMMPAVVAMPAVILQLILAVALSRVVTSVMRKLTRSQLSSALGAMVTGAIMAFFISGWMVLDADYNIMTLELPARLSTLLNVLPSSWGTAAIEAARSGQWAFSIAYLAGMVLVILLLRSLWAILLVKRLTTKPQRNRLSSKPDSPYGFFANRTGTVARKELIAWGRDYTRSGFVYFALFYSIFLCLYPVSAGNLFLLPWTGAIFVITAAGSTANLYGSDGSALWMTLVTSQAERYDIRGRQLAWLLIIAPPALIITFAMIFISGYYWAVPLALPLIIAALGAGAGLVVLNSVHRLEPMTDAHKRGDDMFDHPIGWWQFMSLMLVTLVLIAPAFGLAVWGTYLDMDWVQWSGVPAALLTGSFYYWWFGRLACKRLEARGPELLNLMLRGHEPVQAAAADSVKPDFDAVTRSMSAGVKTVFYFCVFFGLLALFPQGLVPLGIKLSGGGDPLWFLALYLPGLWQWPVIALMIGVGLIAFGNAVYIYFSQRRRLSPVDSHTMENG